MDPELDWSPGRPLGTVGRLLMAVVATFLTAGFLLAWSLEPDPRGFGTHQRLGLPECTVRMLFDFPCPGCGMTTCFAQFVRGNFPAALAANPAGVWLAITCVVVLVWSAACAAGGRLWGLDDPWPALAGLALSWGLTSVGVWGWRCWF